MKTQTKLTATKRYDFNGFVEFRVNPQFNSLDTAFIEFKHAGENVWDATIRFHGGEVKTSAFTETKPTIKDARDIYRSHIQLVDELTTVKDGNVVKYVRGINGRNCLKEVA